MSGNISCVRKLTFEAGHRVYNHESTCKNLHGHSYKLFLHAQAPKLDQLGRVIDFKVLKGAFLPWIDYHWDHSFLWFQDDEVCRGAFRSYAPTMNTKNYKCDFNPTAENMALFILNKLGPELLKGTEVKVTKVVLWETENCYVEVSNEFGVENIQSIEVGAESRS